LKSDKNVYGAPQLFFALNFTAVAKVEIAII
jgi:hypothetical protein